MPKARRNTVLIVEDQFINREQLKMIVSEDYDVYTAADGIEALEVLEQHASDIDIMLVDLSMPRLDGFGLLQRMQENDTYSKIPALVVTGEENVEEEIRALQLGASDFLRKPYNADLILHRMESTLRLVQSLTTIKEAERDTLTTLYTANFFVTYANNYIKSHDPGYYDLVNININNFKLVNEIYGEDGGDAMLATLGAALRQDMRCMNGLATHTTGDEFFLLLPTGGDYSELISKFESRIEYPEGMNPVQVRYGVVHVDAAEAANSLRVMCNHARIACSYAKNETGSNIRFYSEEMGLRAIEEQELVNGFDDAVAEHQFKVYYQPKFNLKTETLAGAEALIRWVHPTRGFISPGEFIPLFERKGLVARADRYVWMQACKDIKSWNDKYGDCVPISVNMSRADIYEPGPIKFLDTIVMQSGINIKQLQLEVTESAYANRPDEIIKTIGKLREVGFTINMDDFGSGYSSLNMLTRLPIDVLKIDMRFLTDNEMSMENPGIVGFVLDLAKYLGVETVAEGVETKEQADILRALGCDIAQGFYYGRPVPADEFDKEFLSKLYA